MRSRDLLSREENTNKASVEIHKIVSGQEGEERDSSKDDEFKNVDIDKIWDETTPALKHKWLWIVGYCRLQCDFGRPLPSRLT